MKKKMTKEKIEERHHQLIREWIEEEDKRCEELKQAGKWKHTLDGNRLDLLDIRGKYLRLLNDLQKQAKALKEQSQEG